VKIKFSKIRLIHPRLINPAAFSPKLLGTEFSYSFRLHYRKFGYETLHLLNPKLVGPCLGGCIKRILLNLIFTLG